MKEPSEQLDEREQAWERLNVDAVIIKLLEEKDSTQGKILLESEVNALCYKTRNLFMTQPPLLELPVPINILGNIHGQFKDLITWFENGGYPPGSNYLFLGGYIDRGKQSLQTICLLLAYKIKYPDHFFLLRGNHESSMVNRLYGFYDDCKKYYHIRLWKTFNDLFNCLPLAAVVGKKIFCCHGGISPDLYSLDQIRKLQRPLDVPDSGIVCDLLWADPFRNISGWASNERGVSYKFGSDVIQKFLSKYDLDLICRAHQPVEDGYEFFSKRHLITIFSAPNYCGEYDNAGAMMNVDERLLCSFKILRTKCRPSY